VAVGGDAEVALHDRAELHLEVDGARHLVVEEEVGDEGPRLLRGLVFRHDDVKDLIGDGPVEPRADDVVLADPVGGAGSDGGDGVDVVEEVVLAEEHADQHSPLGEVGGLEVERDRHMSADAGHVHRRG
jgi:hypothetical protein